jgi:hypothetical protein
MMHPDFNRALRWAPLVLALGVLGAVVLHAPGRQLARLPPAPTQTVAENDPVSTEPTLTDLATWPLFGTATLSEDEAIAREASAGNAPGNLPDESVVLPATSLDIQVRGLAYATTPGRAHAILQVNGQPQQRYQPGDSLTEGVTLMGVRPLEVVISNQGRMEAAVLPVAPAELSVPAVSVLPPPEVETGPDARSRALEDAYRRRGGGQPGLLPPEGIDPSAPIDESFP